VFRTGLPAAQVAAVVEHRRQPVEERGQSQPVEQHGHVERGRKTAVLMTAAAAGASTRLRAREHDLRAFKI